MPFSSGSYLDKVPWDAEEIFTMSDRMAKIYKVNYMGEDCFIVATPDNVTDPMSANHLDLFLKGKDLEYKTLQRLRK